MLYNGDGMSYTTRTFDTLKRIMSVRAGKVAHGDSAFLTSDWTRYEYDSTGIVRRTTGTTEPSGKKYSVTDDFMTFDAAGRMIDEKYCDQLVNDTTWGIYSDNVSTYDKNGRLTSYLGLTRLTYDDDGNLDTLECNTNAPGGHLVDSYGNDISLEQYWLRTVFYYSQGPTGVTLTKPFPKELLLRQNYPNPFNPTTTISFEIPKASNVKLIVYDILGREVQTLVNETKQPGHYDVRFNAHNLASGVYLYRMQAGQFAQSRRFVLVK